MMRFFNLKAIRMKEAVCRQLLASSTSSSVQCRFHHRENIDFRRTVMPCINLKFNNMNKDNLRYMAGHAKWQNVKHIKAEKDRLKSHACNKYVRLITFAVREKGPDPKVNNRLASLLEQGKKENIPSSTLESAMKKAVNKKTHFGTIQILAPGGCLVIIDYETDNVSIMRHEIKTICKRCGANLLQGDGQWRAVYLQKGILKVSDQIDGEPVNLEKALDSAIEAGAEEVLQKKDEDEKTYLEFLCDPSDLHLVKKELEKLSYSIDEAYIGYIPSTTIQLLKEDMTLVDNLLTELGEMQEVVRMYENVQ